jgi:hypothetical protein
LLQSKAGRPKEGKRKKGCVEEKKPKRRKGSLREAWIEICRRNGWIGAMKEKWEEEVGLMVWYVYV